MHFNILHVVVPSTTFGHYMGVVDGDKS
ncbi:hypothetical protein AB1N83_003892 [Pleurotus pulmonarius]